MENLAAKNLREIRFTSIKLKLPMQVLTVPELSPFTVGHYDRFPEKCLMIKLTGSIYEEDKPERRS